MSKKIRRASPKRPTLQTVLDRIETLDVKLTESIKGVNLNLTASIGQVKERLDAIEEQLDVVVNQGVTRQQMRTLMAELKLKGIDLDEAKIFAA